MFFFLGIKNNVQTYESFHTLPFGKKFSIAYVWWIVKDTKDTSGYCISSIYPRGTLTEVAWLKGGRIFIQLNFSSALMKQNPNVSLHTNFFSSGIIFLFLWPLYFSCFNILPPFRGKIKMSEFLIRCILQNPNARHKLLSEWTLWRWKLLCKCCGFFFVGPRLLLFVWQIRSQAHKLCCKPMIKKTDVSLLDSVFLPRLVLSWSSHGWHNCLCFQGMLQ